MGRRVDRRVRPSALVELLRSERANLCEPDTQVSLSQTGPSGRRSIGPDIRTSRMNQPAGIVGGVRLPPQAAQFRTSAALRPLNIFDKPQKLHRRLRVIVEVAHVLDESVDIRKID